MSANGTRYISQKETADKKGTMQMDNWTLIEEVRRHLNTIEKELSEAVTERWWQSV